MVHMLDLSRPADEVAPLLLGSTLWRGSVGVRLTEVEAYLGLQDAASHAFRGPTRRAGVMFGPPGVMYVYLSYGMHVCGNIVCSPVGTASAVLLRAGEVVGGEVEARGRRGDVPASRLASGPGNLGAALGLRVSDSGTPLGDVFRLVEGRPSGRIARGPRIGVARAVAEPLRFWLVGEPSVSRGHGSAARHSSLSHP